MRLTPAQIRTTIAAIRLPEPVRVALLRQTLAGDPNARFVVYAHYLKQQRAAAAR